MGLCSLLNSSSFLFLSSKALVSSASCSFKSLVWSVSIFISDFTFNLISLSSSSLLPILSWISWILLKILSFFFSSSPWSSSSFLSFSLSMIWSFF